MGLQGGRVMLLFPLVAVSGV